MSESRSSFEDELRQEDEEYRYAYVEDFLNTSVATQIRVIREQRGLTQEELAQKIGTKQAGISRLENVNYSAWKTETLRKIARALKVRLKITFETFGSLVDEAEAFSRENLERPTFEDDPRFHEGEGALAPAPALVLIRSSKAELVSTENKRYRQSGTTKPIQFLDHEERTVDQRIETGTIKAVRHQTYTTKKPSVNIQSA
jgi:transcriptional regulator with XRE-family HTH domain